MSRSTLILTLVLLSCSGDEKDDGSIVPLDDADADADTDADSDTDTDADTDVPTGFCDPLPAESGTQVVTSDDLATVIAAAAPGDVLLLASGTHNVTGPILIDKPLTLRSETDVAGDAIISGGYNGGDLFDVTGNDVTFAHLTLTQSGMHLLHVYPDGADVTGFRLHDVHLVDSAALGLLVEGDTQDNWVDDGEVSCSHFELTDGGRGSIASICAVGGIDAFGTRGWTVRDNQFSDFWCATGAAPASLRFWRGARDTEITRNVVADAPLGIVIGQTQDQIGRTYSDDPCGPVILQSIDADVTNNIVFAYDSDLLVSTGGIRAGILAESSCNVNILHNSIYSGVGPDSSIEHTYDTTTGALGNNIGSHTMRRLVDSQLVVAGNIENVAESTWFFPSNGDFHTAPAAVGIIDQGVPDYLGIIDIDIDNEPRDKLPDIGADEQ